MAYIKSYDALGGGMNIRSGTFVSTPSNNLTATYRDFYYVDSDTLFIYEEYNGGSLSFGAFADWLGSNMFSLDSFMFEDGQSRTLVEASDLNIWFDATDDFSNDIFFSNMFAGNDMIIGNDYADAIELGRGNDRGIGNGGNDTLWGQSGSDILRGGFGGDVLSGGNGRDQLFGGNDANPDRFVFDDNQTGTGSGRDIIFEFDSGEDKLALSGIDADSARIGDQSFIYAGEQGSGFGRSHSIWFVDTGANRVVRGDVNGNGAYDFEIELQSVGQLSKFDFIL